MDPTAKVLQCNDPGTAAQEVATIAAGDDITAFWNEWPHTIGPLIVWMAACSEIALPSPLMAGSRLMRQVCLVGLFRMVFGARERWSIPIARGLLLSHPLLRQGTILFDMS